MYNKNFKKALPYIYDSEGGFNDDPNDRGGRTNYGITQGTYNNWNDRHKIQRKDVRQITKKEAEQIYYYDYWLPSGADKIEDSGLAYAVFDTEILCGHNKTQEFLNKCKGDVEKLLELRADFHNVQSKIQGQQKWREGWLNRVNNVNRNAKILTNEQNMRSRFLRTFPMRFKNVENMSQAEYKLKEKAINSELEKRSEELKNFNSEVKKMKKEVQEYTKKNKIKGTAENPYSNKSGKHSKIVYTDAKNEIADKQNAFSDENIVAMLEGFDSGMIADEDHGQKSLNQLLSEYNNDWKKQFNVGDPNTDKGHWITVKGTHIFVKDKA